MAKNNFLSWDTTANNNTDISGINIAEGCAPSGINNAIRTIMAQLRADIDGGVVFTTQTTNYTAVLNDNNAVHRFSAAATLTLTAAATLGADWHYTVIADGGDVTIDPNAAELIDGVSSIVLPNGYTTTIYCTGTAFRTDKQALPLAPKGHINGLVLTNNATDATNDIDVAAGEAASDGTTAYLIALASALTKRLDAGWAVGTNQGGLDTGSVGNNVYYVWLIQRSDTGVVDALFSLSSTSPTMPANYDRKRVIGSFARVAASNCAARSYSQKEATAWTSYTPTLTGVGTATSIVCRSRRVGSNLEVEATWANGTTTAVDFAMSMGAYGTDANVVCDSFWNTRRPIIGVAIWQVSSAAALYVIGQGSFNQVNISISSAGRDGFTPVTGATLGTGTPIGVRYSVPIQGWN